MANNKYIYHGTPYCGLGDGPTPATDAGHAGASGYAWDNINILTGSAPSYGSVAAGDIVHIRSKNYSGSDITVASASHTMGSSNATLGAPIKWVLDNGTVWSTIDGVLTFDITPTSHRCLFSNSYNHFIAKTKHNWIIYQNTNQTVAAGYAPCQINAAHALRLEGIKIDTTVQTGTYSSRALNSTNLYSSLELVDCMIDVGRCYSTNGQAVQFGVVGSAIVNIVNLHINNDGNYTGQTALFTFATTANNQTFQVNFFGGKATGLAITNNYCPIFLNSGIGNINTIGFAFPRDTDKIYNGDTQAPTNRSDSINMMGHDGILGATKYRYWGIADSRDDGNYPYLNATLPDSGNTGWSWKMYLRDTDYIPATMEFAKVWQQTAAAKRIRLEFLAQVDLDDGMDAGNVWMEVLYVRNDTGDFYRQSTQDTSTSVAALTSSTAGWSDNWWGAVECAKYKLVLDTDYSIKQNTMIVVIFYIQNNNSSTTSKVVFVDPDFVVEDIP